MKKKVIIMGAAGRDFHNFNIYFRDNDSYEVVAFTATQIPDIDDKMYPPELAGSLYPNGIKIQSETELEKLIKENNVDLVVFAYSDIHHEYVMHKASIVNALGVDFMLLGTDKTTVKTSKPLISVLGVRTGCGKSQASRAVIKALKAMNKKFVSIRHPMPYGNLVEQSVQRFATIDDLKKHNCTIEEMEEYEPHINLGSVIYAGIDYEAIVREAEKEADIIIWDGGNNDTSFYTSDKHLKIVVIDPHRAGHELTYYPGETNLRMADVILINKIDTCDFEDIMEVRDTVRSINPEAVIIEASHPFTIDKPELIEGKRVLAVEEGPTVTHGEMPYGVACIAARKYGAVELVDPREYAVGKIAETYEKYPDIGVLLPSMGYSEQQIKDLETTINATDCDIVVSGTPIDITRVINIKKPVVRVVDEVQEIGKPTLLDVLKDFLNRIVLKD